MNKLQARRLSNRSQLSWAMYPIFEQRCLRFIEKHQIDFDPEAFRQQLRARFLDQMEDRSMLVVFIEATGGTVIGHFLAWLDFSFGRPYCHVNQLELEPGFTLSLEAREGMFQLLDDWIDRLNNGVPDGAPKVDVVSFFTWHDPEIFARYLNVGCELKTSRHVLEYKRSERKARKDGAILEQGSPDTRH